jgi:hypothetical protein
MAGALTPIGQTVFTENIVVEASHENVVPVQKGGAVSWSPIQASVWIQRAFIIFLILFS